MAYRTTKAIFALFCLFVKRSKSLLFFFVWYVLSVVPSSLTCGHVNSHRMIISIPGLQLVGAVGFLYLPEQSRLTMAYKKHWSLVSISSCFQGSSKKK